MKPILALILILSACENNGNGSWADEAGPCGEPAASPGGTLNPQAWFIGPGNRSVGMPKHPSPHAEGWSFDFPLQGKGSVHYVTFNHGPLTGKSRITMRYRIEAAEGVKIHPQSTGEQNFSQLAPYFQRRGDNWLTDKEHYRWYVAEQHRSMPIVPGEFELVVSLDGEWGAAVKSTSENNPEAFKAAKMQAECVGFVLGGGDGVGHGVYATGPARFVLLKYEVS